MFSTKCLTHPPSWKKNKKKTENDLRDIKQILFGMASLQSFKCFTYTSDQNPSWEIEIEIGVS